jgi:hypothetical protein
MDGTTDEVCDAYRKFVNQNKSGKTGSIGPNRKPKKSQ